MSRRVLYVPFLNLKKNGAGGTISGGGGGRLVEILLQNALISILSRQRSRKKPNKGPIDRLKISSFPYLVSKSGDVKEVFTVYTQTIL